MSSLVFPETAMAWLLQRWPDHGISENLMKDIFVDGLREEFQKWIIPRKPESVGEALRLAFACEQLKSIKVDWRKKECMEGQGGVKEEENDERECQCWKKQLHTTKPIASFSFLLTI